MATPTSDEQCEYYWETNENPLWLGDNAWQAQPDHAPGSEKLLYTGHNGWLPSPKDLARLGDIHREADKKADRAGAIVASIAAALMLVHYATG